MKHQNSFIRLLLAMLLACLTVTPAHALWGIAGKVAVKAIEPLIHHPKVINADEVVKLAALGKKTGGTKEIGAILGARNLPSEVLEDAYIRIAIQQEKIPRAEAEGMLLRLKSVPGFRSTLSKIVGNSEVKSSGHLNELRIADNAALSGYQVKGIGVTFDDGIKSAPTDIDVLLEKYGRLVAIEAKDYLSTTPIPLDKFRADMDSLVEFSKANSSGKVLKVFSITERPNDEASWKLLNYEAERRGVELIRGTHEQQVYLINQLL